MYGKDSQSSSEVSHRSRSMITMVDSIRSDLVANVSMEMQATAAAMVPARTSCACSCNCSHIPNGQLPS